MIRFIKRLFCRHQYIEFVRNIYGDEIIEWGYKRSLWKCRRCGAIVPQEDLEQTA